MAHALETRNSAHDRTIAHDRHNSDVETLAPRPQKRDIFLMKEALWWQREDDGRLLCTLCPRFCRIGEGQAGFCYIRKNVGGKLYSLGYGTSTGFAIDPIEKKPLNHFLPGSEILSFGTAGCNLGCRFCQNWSISKAKLDEAQSRAVTPEIVVELARRLGCRSVAFTYNDPVIFAEYAIDVAQACHEFDIRSV